MTGLKTLLICTILVISMGAGAQESTSNQSFGFLLDLGIEFGGDEIAEVFFTNGEDQSVDAGQGGYIAAGGEYSIDKFAIRGSVGFKYVTTAAENANIRLTRIPLNLSANYTVIDKLRIGAGITAQQGINFKGDGFLPDFEFESATGPKFEIAYAGIGISYTLMNYKEKNGTTEYSANAFGINYSHVFGK